MSKEKVETPSAKTIVTLLECAIGNEWDHKTKLAIVQEELDKIREQTLEEVETAMRLEFWHKIEGKEILEIHVREFSKLLQSLKEEK